MRSKLIKIPDDYTYPTPTQHRLLERMPLELRKVPEKRGATHEKGTPFLINSENFDDVPLRRAGKPHSGSYFVHLTFFYCLWRTFGEDTFHRGNLDKSRLHYLLSDGVIEIITQFDERHYRETLQINTDRATEVFPAAFED